MIKYTDLLKLCIVASLVLAPVAKAANGNTGGYSGGNNGNGVGNTGPGNQGNDRPVGNAGGSTGNVNGGVSEGNPNGNTGGLNGGNNGNGVGNTGPGNQGNDKPVGNACGNDCTTGSVEGGTTGSTDGGSTGELTGSTSGGESTGGEVTGSTDGGTTGGETTGGEATGGETSGGEDTGSTSGGETDGGTTGGETTGGVTETKPKEKFKARLLPLAFGNYDIMNMAVNLTPADSYDLKNNQARLDEYGNGFLVNQIRQWDAGLGILPSVYLQNASGLASLATGSIGLAPTKGRYVQYERLVSDEKTVDKLKALPIPSTKKLLDSYKTGESVYFENTGGILFIAGPGLAGAYAGGSVLAEGGFRTLIKKTDRGANVEIQKAKVRTTSLFTGFTVIKLDGTKVKQLSEGFAFEFDFARGGESAVKTYQQLIAGNIKAAQESAKSASTGVTQVADSKTREISKKRNISVGIPMVAMYNWAAGKTYGETASKAYADKTTTDLNYGVYFKEEKGRFFHKHKKITRAFYATRATTKDEQNRVLAVNEEANFLWNFESDSATSKSFNAALGLMQKDLGLAEDYAPVMEKKGQKLRFVRLQANVKIPESYVKKLISSAITGRDQGEMQREARELVHDYFAAGDRLNICKDEDSRTTLANCERKFLNESLSAVNRIQSSLLNLREKKDPASYTYAVALMGKDLVKNQFVLNAFFSQDTACTVKFDVKLEGRRVSRMIKQVPANTSCR